jgi:hypothetical protein
MIAYQLLTSCFSFVLTAAYGSDLGPPPGICSANVCTVCAYQTPQCTAKETVGLTGFAERPVSPGRPRNNPQETCIPLVRLATLRSPPLLTDSIADVQRDPNRFTNRADSAPTTLSSHNKHVFDNLFCPPVSHDPNTSDKESFMKRLAGDVLTDGPKKGCKDAKPKPLEPGQQLILVLFTRKATPKNMCGYGPKLFYTMTRACTTSTTPAYYANIPPPPPLLPFCCKFLYVMTLILISMLVVVSTVCAFGLAKALDKLTGFKIPCRELLFIFLALFPAPGAATQGLADKSSIQVVVHTNASPSTAMDAVDTVTSWAQLVTACNATSANITLSPTFQMGVYSNQIDFRLVCWCALCMAL